MTQLPLTDRFGRHLRDLRLSVIDRCNFRCGYCMPADREYDFLDREELLTVEEIGRLTRVFAGLGASKLRITGGEPLLRPDLAGVIETVAATDGVRDVAMTTNGYLLARQAEELARAGLDRVTVSLDAVDEEVFGRMNGRGFGLDEVLAGIDAALDAGLEPVKLNMVVQRGVNDHLVVDTARRFKGTGVIVRFIEYMDVGTLNGWRLEDVVPSAELVERIDAEMPLLPLGENYPGEVADRYLYLDGSGEIGFISSVSQPFCGDCTRARLSAEGTLYTCLFAGQGTDLKSLLREGASDAELRATVEEVWSRRADRYSERRTAATDGLELPASAILKALSERETAAASGNGAGSSAAEQPDRVEMFRMGG